ncbi:proteasome assembly chaperone 1 [Octopus bimaculoides]|uniref:proteasome assembly chaperone 1 n=1 Tax=Octopus bimaculoides TaxID=37653 RepID=UPI0022DF7ACF|nr:proteasome assembly chaperone 1 [Octopus bimaculoides]
MATFFGEVLPVFSRATGDDDDFDEDEEQEAELTWKTSVQWCEAAEPKLQDNKLPCSLLIISVGQVASGFCQAYLLKESTKPAGWLSTSLTTDDPTLDHNAEVHLCGKDSVFIQCTKEISPEQSFCWVSEDAAAIMSSSLCRTFSTLLQDEPIALAFNPSPCGEHDHW